MFPVVCMDKSPKQLIGEAKTPIKAVPGSVEKYDYEYRRNGVCNIFMAIEPLAGKRYVKVTRTKTKRDWAEYLSGIADLYKDAERITLVMDNLNTHKPEVFVRDLSTGRGQKAMGQVRVRVHAQARRLAQHGRDRTERALGPMPWEENRQHGGSAKGGAGVATIQEQQERKGGLAVHIGGCKNKTKTSLSNI